MRAVLVSTLHLGSYYQGFFIGAVQARVLSFTWAYPRDAPYAVLMEVATAATLCGLMFNVMGGVLASLMAVSPLEIRGNISERKKRLMYAVYISPHVMIGLGGTCFLFSLNVSTWVLQSSIVFLAATIATAIFSIPVLAYILLRL